MQTNQTPENQGRAKYNGTDTFLQNGQLIPDAISEAQWDVAYHELAGKPSGTKLTHYEYGDFIEYQFNRKKMVLSHAFIVGNNNTLFAISLENEGSLIDKRDENQEGISQEEYLCAKTLLSQAVYFNNTSTSRLKPPFTKLPNREKLCRIIPHPKTNEPITMTFSFYNIDGNIIAIADTILGSTSKVKSGVMRNGKLVKFKIPYKWHFIMAPAVFKNEITVATLVGFFNATPKKITSHSQNKFPIFEMPFFEFDLFDYCTMQLNNTDHNAVRKQMIGILIQAAAAIKKIHSQNIIHRDIKPENIFLNVNRITGETETTIGDFGFSFKANGNLSHRDKLLMGTEKYLAPEIKNGKLYSDNSDFYAFGITLSKIYTLKNGKLFDAESNNTLRKLMTYMTNKTPNMRLNLSYAQVALIFLLHKIDPASNLTTLLQKYESPITTQQGAALIYHAISLESPIEDNLITLIETLEKELASNAISKQDTARFLLTILEEDTQRNSFSANNIKRAIDLFARLEHDASFQDTATAEKAVFLANFLKTCRDDNLCTIDNIFTVFSLYTLSDKFNLNADAFNLNVRNLWSNQELLTSMKKAVLDYQNNNTILDELKQESATSAGIALFQMNSIKRLSAAIERASLQITSLLITHAIEISPITPN